jgi:hypothetical protein
MSTLVACIGEGKGTRVHVARLISAGEWKQIILITGDSTEKGITEGNIVVAVDTSKKIPDMAEDLKKSLKEKIHDTEVCLNLVSGSGKEHMALLSAILRLGLGIRLVTIVDDKVVDITFEDWEKKLAEELNIKEDIE